MGKHATVKETVLCVVFVLLSFGFIVLAGTMAVRGQALLALVTWFLSWIPVWAVTTERGNRFVFGRSIQVQDTPPDEPAA